MEAQENFDDISQLVYQQQIKKQPFIDASQFSKTYCKELRNSFICLQDQSNKSQESNQFYKTVLQVIDKIQPVKNNIFSLLYSTKKLRDKLKAEDNLSQAKKEVKDKNIVIIKGMNDQQSEVLLNDIIKSIQHIEKWLLLSESQLSMVRFIQQNKLNQQTQKFKEKFIQTFGQLGEFSIEGEKCHIPINYIVLEGMIEIQITFLDEYMIKIQPFDKLLSECLNRLALKKLIKQQQIQQIKSHVRQLKVINAKLRTIAQLFPYACIKHKDDLFSKSKTHPRWKKLLDSQIIHTKIYGQPKYIEKSFLKIRSNLNVLTATVNIMDKTKGLSLAKPKNWATFAQSAANILKCAISPSYAQKQAEVMISESNQVLAKEMWNLPQKQQFKKIIQLSLPSIQFSIPLFLPRLYKDYFVNKINNYAYNLPAFNPFDINKYRNDLPLIKNFADALPIRINYKHQLILKQQKSKFSVGNIFQRKINQIAGELKAKIKGQNPPPQTVIFHIHGGGFISMSSFIHQIYTRVWSNQLNVPIVSVDYGKAPEYPYPQGLYDCLEAYLWIIYSMKHIYQFQPKKIVLVGDSAGGNLVAALTNLLIKWGLRKPDGIVLVYPALYLNLNDYTPSLLVALNDTILPHTFLKICVQSYIQGDKSVFNPQIDQFISPLKASDQILKEYPPTRIFVGNKDPFHDDCCRFAQRINQNKPKCVQLTIIDQFPHGFLQFHMKANPHQYCERATKQVENALKELLSK